MIPLDYERIALKSAEEHVALADERVSQQEELIKHLEREHHDTLLACRLLRDLLDIRDIMLQHRACIVLSLERLKQVAY